jgi:hypothetical protein
MSGIRVHSAFRPFPVSSRNPASREAAGIQNAPPSHSAGAAKYGAASSRNQSGHAVGVRSARRAAGQASRWTPGFRRGRPASAA